MKVQYVSICPTEQANEAGCYSFTPELLASVGARYSRNNEGLDAIATKIDKNNLDKSVDSIEQMIKIKIIFVLFSFNFLNASNS